VQYPIQALLTNVTDYRPTAAAKLKETNLPIVIYGAGLMAHGISNVLKADGVTKYFYAVDELYISKQMTIVLCAVCNKDVPKSKPK
jgi:hypothetical protein